MATDHTQLPAITRRRMGRLAHTLFGSRSGIRWDYRWFVSGFVTLRDARCTDGERLCGTTCCAAGLLPVVDPKRWRWARTEQSQTALVVKLRSGSSQGQERPYSQVMDDLCTYFAGVERADLNAAFSNLYSAVEHPTGETVEESRARVQPYHVAAALAGIALGIQVSLIPQDLGRCWARVLEAWPRIPVLESTRQRRRVARARAGSRRR